ncbi:MAG: hypothetical protein JSS02_19935 [Planctomycetes bacterium]|nr:hypothetical protein [Planctomycetota bacterium]
MAWLRLRMPTLIELLAIIAIVAVIAALLIPPAKWGGSGSIRIPVRVLVFDASRGTPIANARVAMFYAPPLHDMKWLEESPDLYDSTNRARHDGVGTTDADGAAVIEYEFATLASYNNPTWRARLQSAWVHVQADGFGGAVIPVRYESEPTAKLRDQKELLVTIGLTPER